MNYRNYTVMFFLVAAVVGIAELYLGYFYQVPQELYDRQDSINRLYKDRDFWCQKSQGVILGSSRTRHLFDIDVGGMKFYSLAADGMLAKEYGGYIEFYKEICQKPAKHILIGLDFISSNGQTLGHAEPPGFFTDRAARPFDYLMVFDYFSTRFVGWIFGMGSWGYPQEFRPLRESLDKPLFNDEDFSLPRVPAVYVHNRWYNLLYGNFFYDNNLISYFQKVKQGNPSTDVRVWITPIGKQLFSQMIKFGLLEEYKQFIRDAVAVFGRVDNFMWINEITAAQENFVDVAHIRYDMLDFLVASVLDRCDCKEFGDFDKILTEDNLDEFFKQLDLFVDQYQYVGDSLNIASLEKSEINKKVNVGDYLDLYLPDTGVGLEKTIQLCITGKSDFAVVQFDQNNRVNSKVYQRRQDCKFELTLLESTIRLRFIPIYDYPLTLESVAFEVTASKQ